jgi:hypothetical protein
MSHPIASLLSAAIAAGVGYYVGKSTGLRKAEVIHDLKETAKETTVLDDEFTDKAVPTPTQQTAEGSEEWDTDDESEGVSSFPELSDDCKMVTRSPPHSRLFHSLPNRYS